MSFLAILSYPVSAAIGYITARLLINWDIKTNREGARQIASIRWYVKGTVINRFGSVLIVFSEGKKRIMTKFFFSLSHPNTSLISELKHLDIITFDFQEKSIPGIKRTRFCANLLITKIGSFG